MNRVIRQMRIGDVPLNAMNSEVTGEGTATPVFDDITHNFSTGRFADQTVIQPLVTGHQRFNHLYGAIFALASSSEVIKMRDGPGDEDAAQQNVQQPLPWPPVNLSYPPRRDRTTFRRES